MVWCGVVRLSVSMPDTWIEFSESNIRRSQSERSASRDIRSQVDQLCANIVTSVSSEWNAVNSALTDRIAEYVDARNKIQAHLSKVGADETNETRALLYTAVSPADSYSTPCSVIHD